MNSSRICILALYGWAGLTPAFAQLIDKTKAPNIANEGINKSLSDEIGAGRGNVMTPNSSAYIINRDRSVPFEGGGSFSSANFKGRMAKARMFGTERAT